MNPSETLLSVGSTLLFLGGVWGGVRLNRPGRGVLTGVVILTVLVANAAFLFWVEHVPKGWDGLTYVLYWGLLALPPSAGLITGAIGTVLWRAWRG
ncbi:MAG: hypothetical protein AB3N23_00765 [Paracoccaceae bacterium]